MYQAGLHKLLFLVRFLFCCKLGFRRLPTTHRHSFQPWRSVHAASRSTQLIKINQASLIKRLLKAMMLTVEVVSQKGMPWPCLTRSLLAAARSGALHSFLVLTWGRSCTCFIPPCQSLSTYIVEYFVHSGTNEILPLVVHRERELQFRAAVNRGKVLTDNTRMAHRKKNMPDR